MKVKYLGESFYNGFGLTNGQIYECLAVEDDALRIIDDEEEDYLYSSNPIFWEIIEDKDNILTNLFASKNK